MVTTINVKCPHCEQVSQIFLSTKVCVIVLNCPSCFSPIMYFRQKIFLLDQQQVKKITGSDQKSTVLKMLEQITSPIEPEKCIAKAASAPKLMSQNTQGASHKVFSSTQHESYITHDDLTNLRIELETCHDSLEFINRL